VARPVDVDEHSRGPVTHHSESYETPAWVSDPKGVPPNLVSKGESFRVKNTSGEREIIVVHPGLSRTVYVFSLSTGQLVYQQEIPAPVPEPARLKQVSSRIGSQVVHAASRSLAAQSEDTAAWCFHVLESVPSVVLSSRNQRDPSTLGVEVYVNIGNASVQQLDEIRPGDVCVCEDATFHSTKALQRHHKTYKRDFFIVSEWDGSKRKLHFVDSKKEAIRLNDLRMGVVKVFRPIDDAYLNK